MPASPVALGIGPVGGRAWLCAVQVECLNEFRWDHAWKRVAAAIRSLAKDNTPVIVHSIPSGIMSVSRYLPENLLVLSWVGQLGQRKVPDDLLRCANGISGSFW